MRCVRRASRCVSSDSELSAIVPPHHRARAHEAGRARGGGTWRDSETEDMATQGERVRLTAFIVQGMAALSITSLNGLTAFTFAWPSYTLGVFTSNATVLAAPMSGAQAALLGSLSNAGALAATPLCAPALHHLGRKYSAMLFGIPFVLCWAIISMTRSVNAVLAAVALAGVGAAGQAVGSVYIAEISQDAVRGALTSTIVSGYFVGLLFSYALGAYLSFYRVVYVHLAMSVMYIISLAFLKESAVYLIKNSKVKEAAISIAFYRCVNVSSKEVEDEINKIKLQLVPRINTPIQCGHDLALTTKLIARDEITTETESKVESEWSFLKRSPSSMRALSTALVLMATMVTMGGVVLQVYAEPLLALAQAGGPALVPPALAAVLLAAVLLLASLLAGLLVDHLGRKTLMAASSLGAGACMLALGSQLQARWGPRWLATLLIYAYCFVYNMGAAVVPFVVTAEVFLPEVRSLCNCIVLACLWTMYFLTLVIFKPLLDRFGPGPVFYGFAVVCFLGATYCKMWLPETRGLSADAIQPLFVKKVKKSNTAKI